jgi:hypothetical protein
VDSRRNESSLCILTMDSLDRPCASMTASISCRMTWVHSGCAARVYRACVNVCYYVSTAREVDEAVSHWKTCE